MLIVFSLMFLLDFIAAFPRCMEDPSQYLLFHVLRSLPDICKTTSKDEVSRQVSVL